MIIEAECVEVGDFSYIDLWPCGGGSWKVAPTEHAWLLCSVETMPADADTHSQTRM